MEKFISTVKAMQEIQLQAMEKGFYRFEISLYHDDKRVSVCFQPTKDDDSEYFTIYCDCQDFTMSRKYHFLQFCLNYEEK